MALHQTSQRSRATAVTNGRLGRDATQVYLEDIDFTPVLKKYHRLSVNIISLYSDVN